MGSPADRPNHLSPALKAGLCLGAMAVSAVAVGGLAALNKPAPTPPAAVAAEVKPAPQPPRPARPKKKPLPAWVAEAEADLASGGPPDLAEPVRPRGVTDQEFANAKDFAGVWFVPFGKVGGLSLATISSDTADGLSAKFHVAQKSTGHAAAVYPHSFRLVRNEILIQTARSRHDLQGFAPTRPILREILDRPDRDRWAGMPDAAERRKLYFAFAEAAGLPKDDPPVLNPFETLDPPSLCKDAADYAGYAKAQGMGTLSGEQRRLVILAGGGETVRRAADAERRAAE